MYFSIKPRTPDSSPPPSYPMTLLNHNLLRTTTTRLQRPSLGQRSPNAYSLQISVSWLPLLQQAQPHSWNAPLTLGND